MTLPEIKKIAKQVIDDNPLEVTRWKNGEKGHMKHLMNQVVIKSSHKAHPKMAVVALNDLLTKPQEDNE